MQPSNPVDKRVLIAVGFFFVFYFAWQNHLAKKYPSLGKTTTTQNAEAPSGDKKAAPEAGNPMGGPSEKDLSQTQTQSLEPKKTEVISEKLIQYQNENIEFQLSNKGMRLTNFKIHRYTDKDKTPIMLSQGTNQKLFEMRLGAERNEVIFDIEDQGNGHYLGKAQIGEMKIERDLKFVPESSSFVNTVKIINPSKEAMAGVSFYIPDRIHTPESSSFLFASFER